MGMTQGNRQSIRRIGTGDICARQLHAHHMIDLALVGVPHTNDSFLDRVRGVLSNQNACARWYKHGDAPRLAQLQGPSTVLVHECLLNGRGIRLKSAPHLGQLIK